MRVTSPDGGPRDIAAEPDDAGTDEPAEIADTAENPLLLAWIDELEDA